MLAADAFNPLRYALEQSGVRYAIGGSWASTAFGEARFTNDVDILAEFTPESIKLFLESLPKNVFYIDVHEATTAIRSGRSFNVIHFATSFKFDFFPAAGFVLGAEELDRAVRLKDSGLSEAAVPFVTPEDILLAKLYWYKSGGEISEVQWRDVEGIVRACRPSLDKAYLEKSALKAGVRDLLKRALRAV